MAEGGPTLKNQWGGNNIKFVPICLGNPHVHKEIQIQKFSFVPPAYNTSETGQKLHTECFLYYNQLKQLI